MGDGASEYDVVGAIAAHLLHVGRLSSEISACALGQRPDGVAADEMCDFGRWLRGMSPRAKTRHTLRTAGGCTTNSMWRLARRCVWHRSNDPMMLEP